MRCAEAPKFCTPPLFLGLLRTEANESPCDGKRLRNSAHRLYSLDFAHADAGHPKFCTPPLFLRKMRMPNKTPKNSAHRLYSLDFPKFSPARVSRTHVVPSHTFETELRPKTFDYLMARTHPDSKKTQSLRNRAPPPEF